MAKTYHIRMSLLINDKKDADEIWEAVKTYLALNTVITAIDENSFIEYREWVDKEPPKKPYKVIERLEK